MHSSVQVNIVEYLAKVDIHFEPNDLAYISPSVVCSKVSNAQHHSTIAVYVLVLGVTLRTIVA